MIRRPVSVNECLYLAAEAICPGLNIQIGFELDVTHSRITKSDVEECLKNIVSYMPELYFRLVGRWRWKYWEASGAAPVVRILSKYEEKEINKPFDPHHGPVAEIILIESSPQIVVFRCFHGIMDSTGVLKFAENVFNYLEKKVACKTTDYSIEEEVLLNHQYNQFRQSLQFNKSALNMSSKAGFDEADLQLVHSKSVSISKNLIGAVAKLSVSIAESIRNVSPLEKNISIMIPVDIRPYLKTSNSSGNWTLPIFISPEAGESWLEVQNRIVQMLAQREHLKRDPNCSVIQWTPLWLLKWFWKRKSIRFKKNKKYPISALATHMQIKFGTFKRVFYIAQNLDYFPLVVTLVSHEKKHALTVSAPKYLISASQFYEFVDKLERDLLTSQNLI